MLTDIYIIHVLKALSENPESVNQSTRKRQLPIYIRWKSPLELTRCYCPDSHLILCSMHRIAQFSWMLELWESATCCTLYEGDRWRKADSQCSDGGCSDLGGCAEAELQKGTKIKTHISKGVGWKVRTLPIILNFPPKVRLRGSQWEDCTQEPKVSIFFLIKFRYLIYDLE